MNKLSILENEMYATENWIKYSNKEYFKFLDGNSHLGEVIFPMQKYILDVIKSENIPDEEIEKAFEFVINNVSFLININKSTVKKMQKAMIESYVRISIKTYYQKNDSLYFENLNDLVNDLIKDQAYFKIESKDILIERIKNYINDFADTISYIDRIIFLNYYGLFGDYSLSLEEIKSVINIPVRNITNKIMEINNKLLNYLNISFEDIDNKNPSISSHRLRKNIYEVFKGFSHDEVLLATNLLDNNELDILKKVFGEELFSDNKYYTITKEDYDTYQKIILPKIKKILNIINNTNNKSIENIRDSFEKNSNKRKGNNIYEIFSEFSNEVIDRAINKLNDNDRDILIGYFGPRYVIRKRSTINKPIPYSKEELEIVLDSIYKLLKSNELNINTTSLIHNTIYDYFKDESLHNINLAISLLNYNDKWIILNIYGNDLNKNKSYKNIDINLFNEFIKSVIPNINKILSIIKSENNNNSKIINSIMASNDRVAMKNRNNMKNNDYRNNIYYYFNNYDFNNEQIDEVIETLFEEEKIILHKRFGNDLKNPLIGELSDEERALFEVSIKNKLFRRLIKLRNGIKLFEYKTSHEKNTYLTYLEGMRYLLTHDNINDFKMTNNINNEEYFEAFTKNMSADEKNILGFKILSLQKRSITNKEIAKLLAVSEDFVNQVLSDVINTYNDENRLRLSFKDRI